MSSENQGSKLAGLSSSASFHKLDEIISSLEIILKECDTIHEQHKINVLPIKSQCDKLLNGLKNRKKTSNTSHLSETEVSITLQQYAKVILDFTFIKENQLVEEEFPEHDGFDRMRWIIDSLKQPQHLVYQVCGSGACPVAILDHDIAECLCWRRGALYYMYCHTMMEDKDRVKTQQDKIVKCLVDGVNELRAMLAVRAPISTEGDITTNSKDTLKLLTQGIYSDTHVLALMYAGEMCSWHWELTRPISQSDSTKTLPVGHFDASTGCSSSCEGSVPESTPVGQMTSHGTTNCATQTHEKEVNFDSHVLGKLFLQRYIEAVKGPLRSAGWDYSKAETLLEQIGK